MPPLPPLPPRPLLTLHSLLTIPPTVTTSAPPPPPASDPLETQAGKVQEAQVRWGNGGGEEEAGLVPTSHSGGRWQRGDISPGAPRPALQGCSLLGNGGCWGPPRKTYSLSPRPAFLNFPLSLLLPTPLPIPSEPRLCWPWKSQGSPLVPELPRASVVGHGAPQPGLSLGESPGWPRSETEM